MASSSQVLVPLAHLGFDHWYGILIYLAPVAIVVASILGSTLRQRREAEASQARPDATEADEPQR